MVRLTFIELVGKKYPLSFSLGAAKKFVRKYNKPMDKVARDIGEADVDMVIDMLSILMNSGCAYKNYFESDEEVDPKVYPIVNGKWTPLPKEAIEIAVGLEDFEQVALKIKETVNICSENEIVAKAIGKKKE